ncbi:hypothetical protein GTY65_41665 [Streptomyces sp. SID8379]|uniref:hypothetical protein n=1 Tax=unclassified Streptomyces TaxID=2593676 RepID=UPI00036B0215|nr:MULTISPECIES: hypothetical protein [unclassified Streptomyces]MYW70509.1 hypothetical protein [Streptomyces sp. SID8379]
MAQPDKDTRAAATDRVAELKKVRDQAHADAENAKATADEAMWKAIAAELDAKTVLQRDVVEATGFSRDHVLRRTKPHRKN